MTNRQALLPRERVLLNLACRPADRPAFCWGFGPQPAARRALDDYLAAWGLDYERLFALTSDLRRFDPVYAGPTLPDNASFWGWTVKPMSYGAGSYDEFDYQPLAQAQTVDDMVAYAWPDINHMRHADLPGQIQQADPQHRFARILWVGNPMEILTWMMGLEKLLECLVLSPEMVHAGMERITTFFEEQMRRSFAAVPDGFDAVFGADDLGTQHGLMISRQTYREMVMPYHRRLYALAHQHVCFVIHHSDGSVYDLLDDLMEAGVDCLEAVQIECRDMQPEKLKSRSGGRLAFQGAVSVQQVLPFFTPEQVRLEVRRLKEILGAGGGYICAPSHALQAGTPPQNVVAMAEEAVEMSLQQIIARRQQRL